MTGYSAWQARVRESKVRGRKKTKWEVVSYPAGYTRWLLGDGVFLEGLDRAIQFLGILKQGEKHSGSR